MVLSVADRLATNGPRTTPPQIERHLVVAREIARWHFTLVDRGPVRPLLNGAELATLLARTPGRWTNGLARAARPERQPEADQPEIVLIADPVEAEGANDSWQLARLERALASLRGIERATWIAVDGFDRVRETVHEAVEGLDEDQLAAALARRPGWLETGILGAFLSFALAAAFNNPFLFSQVTIPAFVVAGTGVALSRLGIPRPEPSKA